MDDIERELQEKSIEKSDVDIQIIEQEGTKRTKKTRSAAQIAAFEKARIARAEKIAEKKRMKEEEKQNKKTKIKEFKETL